MPGRFALAGGAAASLVAAAAVGCGGAGSTAASGTPAIVFAADNAATRSYEIYRLDFDGHSVDLSNSPFADSVPKVSPNGKLVAFVSNRGGEGGIYVVGIDGSGLQRLAAPKIGSSTTALSAQLAWAPNSRALAALWGNGYTKLAIVGPGRAPTVLGVGSLRDAAWSPDSRLVTVAAGTRRKLEVRAFRATGGIAWRVPYYESIAGWSARGLFAVASHNVNRVYDEQGRPRFAFKGRSASWSPNGRRIASLLGGQLEVRSGSGRVLLRKEIPGLGHRRAGIVWAGAHRVVVSSYPRTVGIDTTTGKTFKATINYFLPRSPDGRSYVTWTKSGSRFALRVNAVDGSSSRIYGYVPGCRNDGPPSAAVDYLSLQFVPGRKSLVYQSYCAEPPNALYAVSPEGTGLTRLTHTEKNEVAPAWSPDKAHLAFTRFDDTGQSCRGCPGSLRIVNADGSHERFLTGSSENSDSGPSWSPDGTRILFTRTNFTTPPGLFVSAVADFTSKSLHVEGESAAWGPTRIAYVDVGTNPVSLWTARPDGSDRKQVAEATQQALHGVAWSGDGRLAYIDGPSLLGIVTGSGTQRVQLPFAEVGSIAWSSDGTRLAVTARPAGGATFDVYTVRPDGTDPKRLTQNVDASGVTWR